MQTRNLMPLLLTSIVAACAVQEPALPLRDTVPRQLAEDLASGQIYLDFPDGFPDFTMPDDIIVEGSLDRGFSMILILKSELSTDIMEESIRVELARSGWSELETRSVQLRGGFVRNMTTMPSRLFRNQLCHDSYGLISIGPRNRQGIYNRVGLDWNYSANANVNNTRMPCAQQNEQRQNASAGFNPMAGLNEHMPILVLPEEDRGSRFRPSFGSGISGSGNAYTTSSPLTLDWNMAEINRWFAGQLENQDWEQDASWTGEGTAGSTWRKLTSDDSELAGLLDIIHVEDDNYHLRFRLSYKRQ
ncbi:MAG: hypothetical protein RQ714_08600 [Nitrosomonas sp.]|nr:hypothetical protein [Nitrosomonas sp.]